MELEFDHNVNGHMSHPHPSTWWRGRDEHLIQLGYLSPLEHNNMKCMKNEAYTDANA